MSVIGGTTPGSSAWNRTVATGTNVLVLASTSDGNGGPPALAWARIHVNYSQMEYHIAS